MKKVKISDLNVFENRSKLVNIINDFANLIKKESGIPPGIPPGMFHGRSEMSYRMQFELERQNYGIMFLKILNKHC